MTGIFKDNKMAEAYFENQNLHINNIKYEGGFYKDDEIIHSVSRAYRREWDKGVFIGNGMTGAMIYKYAENRTVWEIGRNDVTAHNFLKGIDWALPRVPIGNIFLDVSSKIKNEDAEIHILKAFASGKIETENGVVEYKSFVPRGKDGIYIEVKTTGNEKPKLSVEPRYGISDRIYFSGKMPQLSLLPPSPYIGTKGSTIYSIQEFITDTQDKIKTEGACVLAWKTISDGEIQKIYISVQNDNNKETAIKKAVDDVEYFFSNQKNITELHENWWKDYFSKSFVDISDKYWTKYYWLQMYKIACSIRQDGVVLDSQGPFMTTTPWPTTVWNLNVELSYSPVFTSNHMELVDSLIKILKKNRDNLIQNAKPLGINDGMYLSRATSPVDLSFKWPDTMEMGNIFWTLFTVNRKNEIIEDENLVKELLFPYVKMAVNSCKALMKEDEQGIIHLMGTSSPEYPVKKGVNCYPVTDCNYTLSLLRWALKKLIEWNTKYKFNDNGENDWIRIQKNLATYPKDENGYMIGKDVPFNTSHRHFSHLMMIYPLMISDMENADEKEIAKRSIEHWLKLGGRLQGYTYTAASAMMSYMKNGDKALDYLNGLNQYLSSNTMYAEKGPVIETPISAAESIHMMLLQSQNGVITPFPAIPKSWHDISYENLLADGGFEVSGEMHSGKIKKIKIHSLCGNNLILRLPFKFINNMITNIEFTRLNNNIISVRLNKNESAIFNI